MSEEIYEQILEFPDQSPSFALGFEAGQIWQTMRDKGPLDLPVHGDNLQLIRQMISRSNYTETIEPLGDDDDWYRLRAFPKEYQL